MKLACLGFDADVIRLAEAARQAGHAIVAAFDVTSAQASELAAPPAATGDDWESLLHGTFADAVIVSAADYSDRRADQLRKLTQAAVPLLLVHPVCEPILAFELEMIRSDTNCRMVTYFPGVRQAAMARLAEVIGQGDASPIGRAEQVIIERTMPRREREMVMRQLSRDMELVRQLLGSLRNVSAVGPEHDAATYENLVVTAANEQDQLARWSVAPTLDADEAVLTVWGSAGRARLTMSGSPDDWQLTIPGEADSNPASRQASDAPRRDDAAAAIDELALAIAGRRTRPEWNELCRTMEVMDAMPVALRRGRKIELYGEEPSESGTFKGIMSAGGCGILMIVLLMFVVGSVIEGFRLPMRKSEVAATIASQADTAVADQSATPRWPLWLRLWPVYPLALFLVLQFLLIVSKKPKRNSASDSERASAHDSNPPPPKR
ncbi:MAG: hypothetical protein KDA55_05925 [Planctomycetales bacterium]|nr:hypothetical protein [Planctomycetales bacterium]